MKIKIKETQPKSGGGQYVAGESYDFPADVAKRWIAEGKAEAVRERGEPPKEEKG